MKKLLTTITLALLLIIGMGGSDETAQAVDLFGGLAGTTQTGLTFPQDASLSINAGVIQFLEEKTTSTGYTYASTGVRGTFRSVSLIGGTVQSLGLEYEKRVWLGLWKDMRLVLDAGIDQEVSNPVGEKSTNVTFRGGFIKQMAMNKITGAKLDLALTLDLFKRDAVNYGTIGITAYLRPGL